VIITDAYTTWLRTQLGNREVALRESTFIGAVRGIIAHESNGADAQVRAIAELLTIYDATGKELRAELERERAGVAR
jgi:hypothetical protein